MTKKLHTKKCFQHVFEKKVTKKIYPLIYNTNKKCLKINFSISTFVIKEYIHLFLTLAQTTIFIGRKKG